MLWFIIYIASLLTALLGSADAEEGVASQYGRESGHRVACGGELNEGGLTAAHNTLNGQSVKVTITDRGPFARGRVIDLTPAAAKAIGMNGTASVSVSKE